MINGKYRIVEFHPDCPWYDDREELVGQLVDNLKVDFIHSAGFIGCTCNLVEGGEFVDFFAVKLEPVPPHKEAVDEN